MPDLVIVFRTHSDVEAAVVRSLLDAHGVMAVSASDGRNVFPMSVSAMGEVRVSVREDQADEARRIIEGHRTELQNGRVVRLRDEFEPLQQAIGYRFRDRGLLEHAMTHTSRANEDVSGGVADNESLEFLGDAVLGFVIADLLFREFPEHDEGAKSKAKAMLVSTATLARLADRLDLGEHLLLGRGEEKTGGRRKQAILADSYEALIAALYLDGGVEAARTFVAREFAELIADVRRAGAAVGDYKSALQEYLQSRDQPLPEYRLAGTHGPDHRKLFEIDVVVNGDVVARGTGTSKKEAEQEGARLAIERLTVTD
jgi:ribonuclease-3